MKAEYRIKEQDKDLYDEAVRIGEQVLKAAEHDTHGKSWQTMHRLLTSRIYKKKSEDLYSGVSGIVLFLIEMHRLTKDKRYIDAATDGASWMINFCKNNPSDFYSFYSGRMGVAYMLKELYTEAPYEEYIDYALEIARESDKFLNNSRHVNDLLNGISGTILGLLHLHAATGESFLIDKIKLFTRELIKNIKVKNRGFYWDYNYNAVSSLCGFSHGSAGIGYVFLELGNYFGAEGFYYIAEQAFLYESQFYDHKNNNWKDLRRILTPDESAAVKLKAYRKNDMEFFNYFSFMNAWCHGAAGIGLSRLRAFTLLNKKVYLDEAKRAIRKTYSTNVKDKSAFYTSTMCHGETGNAEIFLKAAAQLKNILYIEYARKVARKCIANRQKVKAYLTGYMNSKNKEDLSLFNGNAGIGYFLAGILMGRQTSILHPDVNTTLRDKGTAESTREDTRNDILREFSLYNIRKQVLQKNFSRTVSLLESKYPAAVSNYINSNPGNRVKENPSFIRYISSLLKKNEPDKHLKDVFAFEKQIYVLNRSISNDSLHETKHIYYTREADKLIKLKTQRLKGYKLLLNPDTKLIKTSWSWTVNGHPPEANLQIPAGSYKTIVRAGLTDIIEENVTPFSELILTQFKKPAAAGKAVRNVISFIETSAASREKLTQICMRQVMEFIRTGILIKS
jgi:hypothetical protein